MKGELHVMSKQEYRDELLRVRYYIKLTVIAKDLGISLSNLSYFLNGADRMMSIEKLNLLYSKVVEVNNNMF